jgi:hypothetical protein
VRESCHTVVCDAAAIVSSEVVVLVVVVVAGGVVVVGGGGGGGDDVVVSAASPEEVVVAVAGDAGEEGAAVVVVNDGSVGNASRKCKLQWTIELPHKSGALPSTTKLAITMRVTRNSNALRSPVKRTPAS